MNRTPFQEQVLQKLICHCPVYIVGGAVRDGLLNLPCDDLDAVIPLPLNKIEKIVTEIGYNPHRLGNHKQTVSLFMEEERIDLLELKTDFLTDALQRDFTINAIYYDVRNQTWIDPLGGGQDLEARCLRACGKAEERLEEDPIRILRMIRMTVRYELKIDDELWNAARANLTLLESCAAERTTGELKEILISENALSGVRLLDELGYWSLAIPELVRLKGLTQNKYHTKDAWEHTLHVFSNTPSDLLLRLAGLLHDLGKWETASRECRVQGLLERTGKDYYVGGFKLRGSIYPLFAGSYVEVLGGRLDNYPDQIVVKRIHPGKESKASFEWIPDGKRHFLMHEQESARLVKQILPRFRWSMFLSLPHRNGELELILLIKHHMLGTITFMNELRGGNWNDKEIRRKARRLAWDLGWNGQYFFPERITEFLGLWKADFWGGKTREIGDGERFEALQEEMIKAAQALDSRWQMIDWHGFEQFTRKKGIGGERFGQFKAQIRRALLVSGKDSLDEQFLEREYKIILKEHVRR